MTTPEPQPPVVAPDEAAVAVDVAALVRHGGHHVSVNWRDQTAPRRTSDGVEIEPAVPAGYHIEVYPERADVDDDEVMTAFLPVAEGRSPDWAEAWARVFPTNMDRPPVPMPDYSPYLRAGDAIDRAVTEAVEAAFERQGVAVRDDQEWTEQHHAAYNLAAHVARTAVYALVDKADEWHVTMDDLSEAARDRRTPEPRDY